MTRVEDACSSDAADGRRLRVRQEEVLASLQLKGVAVEPHLEHALPLERAAQPRVVEAVHEYIADELNVRRVQTAPLAEMGGAAA